MWGFESLHPHRHQRMPASRPRPTPLEPVSQPQHLNREVAQSAASPTGNRFTAATLGLGPGIREDGGVRVPSPAQTSKRPASRPRPTPLEPVSQPQHLNREVAQSAASPTGNRFTAATNRFATLGLGPGGHSPVGVRVPSPAQTSPRARLAPKTHPAQAGQPNPAPQPRGGVIGRITNPLARVGDTEHTAVHVRASVGLGAAVVPAGIP
jgi:hypothetical protein